MSVRVFVFVCARARAHAFPAERPCVCILNTDLRPVRAKKRGREKGTEERDAKKVTQVGDWVCET